MTTPEALARLDALIAKLRAICKAYDTGTRPSAEPEQKPIPTEDNDE